jgi:hypothetical protein
MKQFPITLLCSSLLFILISTVEGSEGMQNELESSAPLHTINIERGNAVLVNNKLNFSRIPRYNKRVICQSRLRILKPKHLTNTMPFYKARNRLS